MVGHLQVLLGSFALKSLIEKVREDSKQQSMTQKGVYTVWKREHWFLQYFSAVPKSGLSKRGRTQKHAKERKRAQKSANASPQKSTNQEAAQYLPKGCSRKTPPSFSSFQWGRLLEHSFLEHFCLDKFCAIEGKFYAQIFSNTSFGRTLLVPNFGASCSNKLFVGTLRPSQQKRERAQKSAKECFRVKIANGGYECPGWG